MQKIDKIYNYIADRMLAISPDGREEIEIKVIKEAKLEELQGILDVIDEIIKEAREIKIDEETFVRDVPSVVIGMGDKTYGTRIKNVLWRYPRYLGEAPKLKDLRNLRYNNMIKYRNMGPKLADVLKAFCISQDLWEDPDNE